MSPMEDLSSEELEEVIEKSSSNIDRSEAVKQLVERSKKAAEKLEKKGVEEDKEADDNDD